ncbi:MAG: glycosyltransferase [Oscillospiraceae bacterium]|nr:glycosyltransferase [Oscillospiraceae bacterium]
MKILQVNNVYANKSTGKITKQIYDGLTLAGHEALAAYGRGETFCGKGITRLCPDWYGKLNSLFSRFTGLAYGGCYLSTSRLINLIKKEKPDVVHLQCINGHFINIYRLINWLKKNKIKTVVSLHAEFMYTANCGHAFDCDQWKHGCKKCPDKRKSTKSWFFDNTEKSWKRMKKAFEGFENDCVVCPVSLWTEERAKQSDILENFKFKTVFNGVDTKVFSFIKGESPAENTVLNVTACFSNEKSHPKGGRYLTELARRMPHVEFLVAGKTEYVGSLPENLHLLGEISDQSKLAKLYNKAKVSVLTSQRETFSMPCAESLCCGTPVVGFKAGAPEQISLPEYSGFVEYGDVEKLEALIEKWLEKEDICNKEISDAAAEAYSTETMIESFIKVYEGILWK